MIALLCAPAVPLIGVALVLALGLRPSARALIVAGVVWVASAGIWFLVIPLPDVAALQGAIIASVTLVIATVWPALHRLAVAALALLALVPLSFAGYDRAGGWLVASLDYVDFAALGMLGLAMGATALVLGWRGGEQAEQVRERWPLGSLAALIGALGWIALVVGSELAVDEITPILAANVTLAVGGGLAGWLGGELLLTRRVTPEALPAGLTAGALGVAAGVPWLPPAAAASLGVIAGISAAVAAAWASRDGRRPSARLAAITLPPSIVGLLGTGLLTSGPGWVNSGQPDLVFSELLGGAVIVVWAAVVALLVARVGVRRARATRAD